MNLKKLEEEIFKKLKSMNYFDRLLFVYLFGSQNSGGARKNSDIDVCLFYDIKDKRELHKLELKIKGIFPEKYDMQFFQFLPLYIKKEIFRGKLIYYKDMKLVFDIALKTFRDFEEFEPRYLVYVKKNYGFQDKNRRKIGAVSGRS